MEKSDKNPYRKIAESFIKAFEDSDEIELDSIEIAIDKLELLLSSITRQIITPTIMPPQIVKPIEVPKVKFEKPKMVWPGKIIEVEIGATRSMGGTRDKTYIIGGEKAPSFYFFEKPEIVMPHKPIFALDIFDMKISLPKAVRMFYGEDVLNDPAEWARIAIEKFNADMITLHLVSTDPNVKNTSPSEAAKIVENVLQAVKVPICVGGSGNPEKDVEVFSKISEIAEGERILINSLNLDMDLKKVLEPIKKYGHVVIDFSPMDLDKARQLNRKVYDYLPKNMIVIDMNCAGIGYGLEYGYTATQRARLAALRGDEELQHPLVAGVSNAWAAREAWLKMDPLWGPKEIRGPIWELLTGLCMLLAGADYFMTVCPTTPSTLKEFVEYIYGEKVFSKEELYNWVSAKIG